MKKNCLICKKKFYKRHNQSKKQWKIAKFCSPKCKWDFGRIKLNCQICDKSFIIKKGIYRRRGRKFCSIECSYKRPPLRYWLGKKLSNEHKAKLAESHRAAKNYLWIKDRTKLCRITKQGERRTSAYFFWRKSVWTRDKWKCIINNNDCKGRIETHHILGWIKYPELRYEIKNGITLCHAHHPRKRAEEKRLIPVFQELVSVSKEQI